MVNALTIDVEDYFQLHAFSGAVHQEDWDSFEPRVERNTHRLLDLLDTGSAQQPFKCQARPVESEGYFTGAKRSSSSPRSMFTPFNVHPVESKNHSTRVKPIQLGRRLFHRGEAVLQPPAKLRATFFVLGWIADRFPSLVKEIHRRGHEVACHGYAHKCIFNQTREEFTEDIKRAKTILEDLTGEAILGYRAPSFSITRATLWSLEIICELGFRYDSSIFPVKHDSYGLPDGPRFPCLLTFNGTENVEFKELEYDSDSFLSISDSILEFPLTTIRFSGHNIPASGGGYFRLFPYPLTRHFLKGINEKEGRAFIFYIHPWEIDPDIPKIKGAGILSKFRTYVNLDKTENRFKRLLSDFHFSSVSDLLK